MRTPSTGTLAASTTRLEASFPDLGAARTPVGSPAHIFLGNRRIWTFQVGPQDWDSPTSTLGIDWPPSLVPHLSGVGTLRLEIYPELISPAAHVAEGAVQFGDAATELTMVDPLTGEALIVNKWGRLTKSFESATGELKNEVLNSTHRMVALLKDALGLEVFISGGTLLGMIRDGELIHPEDGAELAYLSPHRNPSDIVLESYRVEQVLKENGVKTIRHSGGHLQLTFGGTGYTDGHSLDLVANFVCEGWFYGNFHARKRAASITVLPIKTIVHGSLELPVPANSGQMLAAIYGPGWETPDPAHALDTPEPAARRFYWWLNHFDMFRADWEDYHRRLISHGTGSEPTTMGQWLLAELAPGSTVLELGCGVGADALALAAAGHRVLACDYSRSAIAAGTPAKGAPGPDTTARFEVANLNSVRDMAVIVKRAAELAGPGQPVQVYSRNVFDTLHYLGRDTALLTISHLLARGGNAYLQVRNPKMGPGTRDAHEPLGERIFEPWEFSTRLAHYGLEIVKSNFVTEPGSSGSTLSYVLGKVSK